MRYRSTLLWLAFSLPLAPQHTHAPSSEKPAVLLPGVARYHHPIVTRSSEAQAFFDQGLTMIYGFNRFEAVRSFRRAAELDPRAPMPHWGLALAHTPHVNMDLDGDVDLARAHEAIQRARSLAPAGPERDYIEALAPRTSPDPKANPAPLNLAYIDSMAALHRRYPDDLDAAVLYAESLMVPHRWQWFTPDGKPNEFTAEAIAVLEEVMLRHPGHQGANHLHVHAVEMGPDKTRGLPSALRLLQQPPGTGHLVHMAGHIFLQTGDWDLVARSNEHAVQMDRGYMHLTGVTTGAYAFGYHPHNLHFIVVARMAQGRFEDAWRAVQELEAAAQPGIAAMPEMADYFLPNTVFVLARFQKWDPILQLPAPAEKLLVSRAIRHYARALAQLAQGRRAAAAVEQQALEAVRRLVPPGAPFSNNTLENLLKIPAAILDARLAPTPAASIDHWKRAVAAQDALAYDEPAPWYYPVRESLGAALLRDGQAAPAEAVFREGLRRQPRNGRLLFGLLESLRAQNNTAAAGFVQMEFDRAWKQATVKLRLEDL